MGLERPPPLMILMPRLTELMDNGPSESRWDDRKCSLCGALAHCQTLMYLQNDIPAPGMEYLCRACKESVSLPPRTSIIVTRCAEPSCGMMAGGRFEAAPVLREEGDSAEVHYFCGEHGWRWRQSLGPEWEMTVQSVSANARENGAPQRLLRDDLQGAVWLDESQGIN